MEDIEVPHYFTCPISLQIMKDPVTTITGITYDRDSIEHWLFKIRSTTCPVTKQPLPTDSDLTPNHTLRRLIQAWCTENSSRGIDRIPTPKPPLTKDQILKLLKDLDRRQHPQLGHLKIIKQLEVLASENDRNRKLMAEAGVFDAVMSYIVTTRFDQKNQDEGLKEALIILNHLIFRIPAPTGPNRTRVIDSLTWILGCRHVENHVKGHLLTLLQSVIENNPNPSELDRLKPEFFNSIVVGVLRGNTVNKNNTITTNAALKILLETGQLGRNRVMMVESGAVFELVELGFGSTEVKTTELVLGVLFHLCCCADGRAEFLRHEGSIFAVSNRIYRVSPAADELAVRILSLICRFSGTKQVLQEMVEVGAVSRLCVLLQVECDASLKEKARELIKTHSKEWKEHPCFGDSCYPN
ncbi:Coatomer beta subunit [Trema orientale]|uniref:U-box domain-containing protein n=1 Tax=Trema orientale TaxID=63057 RepID=A0A2P5FHZ8_TREOI|nr:Coatomer beta subunit [Trema orientale]